MKHSKREWGSTYNPVAPKTYGDARLALNSWKDTRIPMRVGENANGEILKADYRMDDLRLDDDVREELSGPYGDFQFRVLDLLPRPVIIVYEDGEEPMELARWIKTYRTNMRAIEGGWDENRRKAALPQPFMFYLPDGNQVAPEGDFFRYLEDTALEYRDSALIPRMWEGKGRRRENPQGYTLYTRDGAQRAFYSPWRPWPFHKDDARPRNGVWSRGKPKTGNTATLGIEFLNPQDAIELAREMELAQMGAMSWEWYDLPASERKRGNAGNAKRLKSPAVRATEGLDAAYKALALMDKDDVDEILSIWFPRLKKLSLIKTQDRD